MNPLCYGMVWGKSSISPSKRGRLGCWDMSEKARNSSPWVEASLGIWGASWLWWLRQIISMKYFLLNNPSVYTRYRVPCELPGLTGGCFPSLQNLKSLGNFKVNSSHGGREDLAQIKSYLPGAVWHSLLWFSGREKLFSRVSLPGLQQEGCGILPSCPGLDKWRVN